MVTTRGIIPFMAELFRLMNYSSLPRPLTNVAWSVRLGVRDLPWDTRQIRHETFEWCQWVCPAVLWRLFCPCDEGPQPLNDSDFSKVNWSIFSGTSRSVKCLSVWSSKTTTLGPVDMEIPEQLRGMSFFRFFSGFFQVLVPRWQAIMSLQPTEW